MKKKNFYLLLVIELVNILLVTNLHSYPSSLIITIRVSVSVHNKKLEKT